MDVLVLLLLVLHVIGFVASTIVMLGRAGVFNRYYRKEMGCFDWLFVACLCAALSTVWEIFWGMELWDEWRSRRTRR